MKNQHDLVPRYAVMVHNVNEQVETIFGEHIEEEYWDVDTLLETEDLEEAVQEVDRLSQKYRWLMPNFPEDGWFSAELMLGESWFTLAYSPGLNWDMARIKTEAMNTWLSYLGLGAPGSPQTKTH